MALYMKKAGKAKLCRKCCGCQVAVFKCALRLSLRFHKPFQVCFFIKRTGLNEEFLFDLIL